MKVDELQNKIEEINAKSRSAFAKVKEEIVKISVNQDRQFEELKKIKEKLMLLREIMQKKEKEDSEFNIMHIQKSIFERYKELKNRIESLEVSQSKFSNFLKKLEIKDLSHVVVEEQVNKLLDDINKEFSYLFEKVDGFENLIKKQYKKNRKDFEQKIQEVTARIDQLQSNFENIKEKIEERKNLRKDIKNLSRKTLLLFENLNNQIKDLQKEINVIRKSYVSNIRLYETLKDYKKEEDEKNKRVSIKKTANKYSNIQIPPTKKILGKNLNFFANVLFFLSLALLLLSISTYFFKDLILSDWLSIIAALFFLISIGVKIFYIKKKKK